MPNLAPWTDSAWLSETKTRVDAALATAGRPLTGPLKMVKSWGRSCLHTAPTAGGILWIKHGYGLPPGEEQVLDILSGRWPDRVPGIVATWTGGVAMEPLPGRELSDDDPVHEWVGAARALAEIAAGETDHAEDWLRIGVRDRQPGTWKTTILSLLESDVVRALDDGTLRHFEALVPEFIDRFIDAFSSPATLVHQDSGCCNIHITQSGPIIYDWADVVVGHSVFSCDRLLDQVPNEYKNAVIDAFREPIGISLKEFRAMRRSNVLHEVVRYHDELAHLSLDDPAYQSLANSVRSQIRVLVEHEARGSSGGVR